MFEAIGTVVSILALACTIAGFVKAYGAMQQQVRDQSDDIAEDRKVMEALAERVEKAEIGVAQTQRLADAIEHMGDKFATEIKRLGEVWTIDRDHTREQLEEIKGRLNRRAER